MISYYLLSERLGEISVDDDAPAIEGDATAYGVGVQKQRCNCTDENNTSLESDSASSDQSNEKTKKVKCHVNSLKLLFSRKFLYVMTIAVLIIGGILSAFYPNY